MIAWLQGSNDGSLEASLTVGSLDLGLATIAHHLESAAAGLADARTGPSYMILNTVSSAASGGGSHWFAVVYEVLPPEAAQ